jgi:putative methionine-R-sulfoxide reductase with GAF domain
VVPIVHAHHEKWDGSGYPIGIAGEAIPIGARILSAVDCLDALASDRQYRKALPLDEAMAQVVSESGRSFDPKIVEILQRRYIELEKLATEQPVQPPLKLSTNIKVERGLAPDAGFAGTGTQNRVLKQYAENRAAKASEQVQAIVELARLSRGTLQFGDICCLLWARLQSLVPHDAFAVYAPSDGALFPKFVAGDNSRLFSSLRIPLGEGLSGWVAQNHKPILNGNPSVEPGYLSDPTKYSTLRSGLAVPVEGPSEIVAVLAVYRSGQDAFTTDDLRVLETVAREIIGALDAAHESKASATGA